MISAVAKNSTALTEGQQAGSLQLPASLNPYDQVVDVEEHADWERGRLAAIAARLERLCPYSAERRVCDCGGRGLCLDVA